MLEISDNDTTMAYGLWPIRIESDEVNKAHPIEEKKGQAVWSVDDDTYESLDGEKAAVRVLFPRRGQSPRRASKSGR